MNVSVKIIFLQGLKRKLLQQCVTLANLSLLASWRRPPATMEKEEKDEKEEEKEERLSAKMGQRSRQAA